MQRHRVLGPKQVCSQSLTLWMWPGCCRPGKFADCMHKHRHWVPARLYFRWSPTNLVLIWEQRLIQSDVHPCNMCPGCQCSAAVREGDSLGLGCCCIGHQRIYASLRHLHGPTCSTILPSSDLRLLQKLHSCAQGCRCCGKPRLLFVCGETLHFACHTHARGREHECGSSAAAIRLAPAGRQSHTPAGSSSRRSS